MGAKTSWEFFDLLNDEFGIRAETEKRLTERMSQVPVDVREALRDYVPSADPDQIKVIQSNEETIRLIAPAGSGKTLTMVNRALRLVKSGQRPDRLLILTFDQAAKAAIEKKINESVQELGIQKIEFKVSTLNAFGLGILRKSFSHEPTDLMKSNFKNRLIYDFTAQLRREGRKEIDLIPENIRNKYYFEFFALLKNNLFDPRKMSKESKEAFADFVYLLPQAEPFFMNVMGPSGAKLDTQQESARREKLKSVVRILYWMFCKYESTLHRARCIDYDDQKLRAYVCLQEQPEVLENVQSRYDEVMVDEFQDINRLDFAFIKSIAEKSRLLVVGDDDQAIYGFRGCSPEYIIKLPEHIGRSEKSYELRTNYRCPPNIVEHATRLIRWNVNRIDKSPVSASKIPANITVVPTATAGLEAQCIVQLIRQVRERNSMLRFSDFAVLYRTNAQSLPLQVEFILNDIPYQVRNEDNILENEALFKFLTVLRVRLARRENREPAPRDLAVLTASYFKYVTDKQVEGLTRLFEKNSDVGAVLTSEAFYLVIPKARRGGCAEAVKGLFSLGGRLSRVINYLATEFKGFGGIFGTLEDVIENRVPLGEIFDLAANHRGSEKDFLSAMESALERARNSNAGRNEKQGVGLLTYFRAKGEQWHSVILTTCNEGLIPHKKAPVEDERRLFYVAMTRAEANLMISYVGKSCNNKVGPSRFLAEAGFLNGDGKLF